MTECSHLTVFLLLAGIGVQGKRKSNETTLHTSFSTAADGDGSIEEVEMLETKRAPFFPPSLPPDSPNVGNISVNKEAQQTKGIAEKTIGRISQTMVEVKQPPTEDEVASLKTEVAVSELQNKLKEHGPWTAEETSNARWASPSGAHGAGLSLASLFPVSLATLVTDALAVHPWGSVRKGLRNVVIVVVTVCFIGICLMMYIKSQNAKLEAEKKRKEEEDEKLKGRMRLPH